MPWFYGWIASAWQTDAGFSLDWFYPVAMKYSNGYNFRDKNIKE